jgi:hypothetical protein
MNKSVAYKAGICCPLRIFLNAEISLMRKVYEKPDISTKLQSTESLYG